MDKSFDTSIETLLERTNSSTLFLSDWNKSENILNFPNDVIDRAAQEYKFTKNKYFFSDEFECLKNNIISNRLFHRSDVKIENLGIFTNGTASAYLALYALRRKHKKKPRVLLITPTYYAYIKILQEIGAEIHFVQINIEEDSFAKSVNEIKLTIVNEMIDIVILTSPLFGCGRSMDMSSLNTIETVCEKMHCSVIIDYIYGGLKWESPSDLIDQHILSLTVKCPNIVLLTSPAKQLFLNGIKTGLVIASPETISIMEKLSVHTVGSMSYIQIALLKTLLSKDCDQVRLQVIKRNCLHFKENYELLLSATMNTSISVMPCEEGQFCLLRIPVPEKLSGMEISKIILTEINILTLPHDRYLFHYPKCYFFRLNLALERHILLGGISKLISLNFNKVH